MWRSLYDRQSAEFASPNAGAIVAMQEQAGRRGATLAEDALAIAPRSLQLSQASGVTMGAPHRIIYNHEFYGKRLSQSAGP